MAESAAKRLVSITPNPEIKHFTKVDTTPWTQKPSQGNLTMGHADCCCTCYKDPPLVKILDKGNKVDTKMIEKMMEQKEIQLRKEFQENLEKETNYLKERFDFILQNEQVRSSLKLREAHRERKEKIRILTQQLECKNIAGLMYVMCAERARSKFEKLQIIEKYTNYINGLNEILEEGQELILNLSRGYKTAARVDYEWQTKMKKVVTAFQNFVFHFAGGSPEQNQYFFDVPSLLHTDSPKEDDPSEDPIEEYEEPPIVDPAELPANKEWWEKLDLEDRPFAVFGDMHDFTPEVRRETLKKVKAPKTAPKKWKEYIFRDMYLLADCPKADEFKNEYLEKGICQAQGWECENMPPPPPPPPPTKGNETLDPNRRVTTGSVDLKGNMMGSILKLITASGMIGTINNQTTKANLLGARDSMEIVSTTKFRDVSRKSQDRERRTPEQALQVGSRKTSLYFDDEQPIEPIDTSTDAILDGAEKGILKDSDVAPTDSLIEHHYDMTFEPSTTQHSDKPGRQDSLTKAKHHVKDKDYKISYEKACPIARCQRGSVSAFMKTLPAYMQEHTFTYREQTFDKYEICTPEQLTILRNRIEAAKKKPRPSHVQEKDLNPLLEWKTSVEGIACQTSMLSFMDLPPCTCKESSIISGVGAVYKLTDLIPVKQHLDQVKKECFFDDQIQFNRFKVIGQDSTDSVRARNELNTMKTDFTRSRLQEVRKILKQHPSLCDIFQANIRC